ncbi:MaoC/PaaZ C-terminal domain-containing protein [Brooklawnia cerclae]|uniref:Acyl dehydratase n=2 Tax=Brooklawnia cerclae TaxID=349934 RepID=A0ABX0SK74_9ACTN|nr:acyl dehydratase [Brooklawnia cerclae]
MELHARYFEDFEVGERVECGSRTIGEAEVAAFAGLTQDFHPAHMDVVFATKEFGGRLVHGALTFSVVVGLTVEYNPLAFAYGYDRIRFPNAMKCGDTITAVSEVVSTRIHEKSGRGLVVKRYTGTNQEGLTVLSCEHTLAVARRGTSA